MKKTGHFFNNSAPTQQSIATVLNADHDKIIQTMTDLNVQELEFFMPSTHYNVNNRSIEASQLGFADLNIMVTGDMTLLEFTSFSKYLLDYFPETDVEFFTYDTLNQMLVEKSKQLSLTDDMVVAILEQVIDSIEPVVKNGSNDLSPL